MKSIVLFLLLAGSPWAFGQTDTNVVAVGNWSEPVTDSGGYTLRGRLLVYDAEYYSADKMWGYARIYLELQHICTTVWRNPAAVYFDFDDLHFGMHNGLGLPIRSVSPPLGTAIPLPYWATLPCDSTLRLLASPELVSGSTKPNGLSILVLSPLALWEIRPGSGDRYLLATFSPQTNHPSALNCHVWQGTLNLPKVRLPAKKP